MAELHLERKRSSSGPLIVFVLLLLALAAWWFFGRGDGTRETDLGTVAPTTPTAEQGSTDAAGTADGTITGAPDAVNDYLRFTAGSRASSEADHTHQYTADGIRRLAAALAAVADRDAAGDVSLRRQGDALRERADALQRNPAASDHAEHARDAFVAAAEMLQSLALRSASAAGSATDVRDAAAAIRPDALLLEQTAEVQQFFDRAADALRAMAAPANG